MIAQANNRIWIIVGVIVIIATLLGGWFLGVSPQFDAMNRSNSERELLVERNALAELEIAALKAKFEKLPELEAQLAEMRKSVPEVSNLESFTAEIRGAEAASGAVVLAISYAPAEPFVATEEFAGSLPAVDPTRMVTIPFTVSARGSRDSLLALLGGIQNTPRLTVVNQVSLAGEANEWGLDVSGVVYVLLEDVVAVQPETAPVEEPLDG